MNNKFWIGYIIASIVWIITLLVTDSIKPKEITIERSSDSDWELSEKNYRDTIITDTVYLNARRDTVYPTTEYKRIEL